MRYAFTKIFIGRNTISISVGIAMQILLQSFFMLPVYSEVPDTLWSEDWEGGIGSWYADNGLWEAGVATVGPDSGHLSDNCVGTLLNANYPPNADTRLISPSIKLPSKNLSEKIQLKLWHWFKTQEFQTNYPYSYNPDKCIIQVSVNSGEWKSLRNYCSGLSGMWTQIVLDVSAYADSTIRLGFYFYSTGNNEHNGWYIDDINITKSVIIYKNPEDFESGIDDWSVDNGLWQIGVPTIGPSETYSGEKCAAIYLNGNYPYYANTRLISPEITLKPKDGETPALFFWHWFRMKEYQTNYPYSYNPDYGYIQVKTKNGDWQTVEDAYTGISTTWTQARADLSAYADSTVRIGFYFTSTANNEDNGWYIDDIRLEGVDTAVVKIFGKVEQIINKYTLFQNYANPFNPSTTIKFTLPISELTTLKVYNILGKEVATLVSTKLNSGNHTYTFDGKNLASGVYYYQLIAGNYREVKKMILLR